MFPFCWNISIDYFCKCTDKEFDNNNLFDQILHLSFFDAMVMRADFTQQHNSVRMEVDIFQTCFNIINPYRGPRTHARTKKHTYTHTHTQSQTNTHTHLNTLGHVEINLILKYQRYLHEICARRDDMKKTLGWLWKIISLKIESRKFRRCAYITI